MCSVDPMDGMAPILLGVVHGQLHPRPQFILPRVLISLNGKDHSKACCTILKRCVATILKSDVRHSYGRSGSPRGQPVCKAVMEGVKRDVFSEGIKYNDNLGHKCAAESSERRFNVFGAFVPAQNQLLHCRRFHYYPDQAFLNSHHSTR